MEYVDLRGDVFRTHSQTSKMERPGKIVLTESR